MINNRRVFINDKYSVLIEVKSQVTPYLLDEAGNLSGVSDVKGIESLSGEAECVLLHGLQHICLSYNCLPFQHGVGN